MAIKYKIDVVQALKDKGYTSYSIRKNNIMGQATYSQLRHGELVSWATMNTLCELLDCQPGDLIEYVSN